MSYIRIGWPRMYAEDEKTEQYVIDTGSEINFVGLGTVHYHDWAEIVMSAIRRTDLDDNVFEEVEQAVVDEFVDEDAAVIRDQDELMDVYRDGAEELAAKGREFVEKIEEKQQSGDEE